MNLTLRVWRQKSASARGRLVTYEAKNISPDMSFLEMLDVVNEELIDRGEPPIAFEHDCREGICGTCGFMINGVAHGPKRATTVCQLHMRSFRDGDRLTLEPWRARAFPVIKDLIVDRSAFDRIVQAGGFISAPTGSAPDANAILVRKEDADLAFDAATLSHLGLLPQGQPERSARARNMVAAMDREMFGSCTNAGECEAVCPKEIDLSFIARLNRDLLAATFRGRGARNAASPSDRTPRAAP